tara:strand:- start:777 stop:1073 length:297 start_codon:yes stop_codon:yes gene_type:complete
MWKLSHYFVKSSLKRNLKEYKSKFAISFIIGIFIATIPHIYNFIENLTNQKLIQEQRKLQVEMKEKICMGNNSDYMKFLNLGFPDTAIKKFNTCMKEQ